MGPYIIFSEEEVVLMKQALEGLSERGRRLYLGQAAVQYGRGAVAALSSALNVSPKTITRGKKDVQNGETYTYGERDRAPGAGRPTVAQQHRKAVHKAFAESGIQCDGYSMEEVEDVYHVITSIVEVSVYGDPMTDKKWINATAGIIRQEIMDITGQCYSKASIKAILRKMGYSLQKNQKYNQVGCRHPLRDRQFRRIEEIKNEYLEKGWPVVSIDSKAKEKVGDFINSGQEYRKRHCPRRVLDHDFAMKFSEIYPEGTSLVPPELMGKPAVVTPYGVYCLNCNRAHVTLGISHETSEFAAGCILNWWNKEGKALFPDAGGILILADGGGSNRSRGWLFKIAIQQLSDDIGIPIEICHYPPGCSKYDPIERRLWSQVSHAWAAKPLKNLEVISKYISFTSTTTGLTVTSEIDSKVYLTEREKANDRKLGKPIEGIDNTQSVIDDILIEFYGEGEMKKWNYRCSPHEKDNRWTNYNKAS